MTNLLEKLTSWCRPAAGPTARPMLPFYPDWESAERAIENLPKALRESLGLGHGAPKSLFDRTWLNGQTPDGILVLAFRYAFAPLARSLPRAAGDTHGPAVASLVRWRSEEARAKLEWMRDEMLRVGPMPVTAPAWTPNALAAVSQARTPETAGGPLEEYAHCDIWADGELLASASNILHALAGGDDDALASTPQEAEDLHRIFVLWYGLSSTIACAYREWRYACDEFRLAAGLVAELPPEEVPVYAAIRAALDHPMETP